MESNKPYYDITIEDNTTGNKIEHLSMDEVMEFLGIKWSYIKGMMDRGFYKNYKVTGKVNPDYIKRRGRKTKEIKQNEDQREQGPVTVNLMRMSFEALRVLEDGAKQYGFKDINDFLGWLDKNRFVEKELK